MFNKTLIHIKHKALEFLRKKGYQLLKIDELESIRGYYRQVLIENQSTIKKNKIDSIVFSKDRAMQLCAFLRSYNEMVQEHGSMYILYKTTNDRHENSYSELKEIFRCDEFIFIKEHDFREQLIEICNNSSAKVIGLFVDDMIFIQKINYSHLLKFETIDYVVSLGRGPDLDYSLVLEKFIKVPEFASLENGYLKFKWDEVDEYSDWSYPLGVGGYFYGNAELNVMLRNIQFKAPNSLENNLQHYKPFFIHRYGVCFNQIASVNVPANLVQTEGYNPILGMCTIDDLLKLWEEGYIINLSKFYYIKGSIAQVQKYQFVKRK